MNHENEIKLAWNLCQLLEKLNVLIWNQYENEFIERYLKEEEEKYCETQSEKDLLWEMD